MNTPAPRLIIARLIIARFSGTPVASGAPRPASRGRRDNGRSRADARASVRTGVILALPLLAAVAIGCKPARTTGPATPPPGNAATADARATDAVATDAPATGAATDPLTVPMRIGSETFHLEVADSDEEQKRGLMYRESMPQDHGMIFVNEDEAERSFWMEATLIPLDILYLDRTGRVISIKRMKPRDRTGVPSDGPAMYAIELNQGAAARAGVAVGDRLDVPASPRPNGAPK